jgi:MYXO-CTERM domain-containing protein
LEKEDTMSGGATAGAAAAAAAAARRRRNQEEEEMTTYSGKDLAEAWEFKILRSNNRAFRRPENLRKYLEEEARAGWLLVEKFDDSRIRLKRPASARGADSSLNFDPYRTQVGLSDVGMVFLVLGVTFGITVAVIGIVGVLVLLFK